MRVLNSKRRQPVSLLLGKRAVPVGLARVHGLPAWRLACGAAGTSVQRHLEALDARFAHSLPQRTPDIHFDPPLQRA